MTKFPSVRTKGRALLVATLGLIVLQAIRPWLPAAQADRCETPLLDHESTRAEGEIKPDTQPPPMPRLVLAYAIGGGSVPEPGFAGLLIANFTVLCSHRRR